MSKNLMAVEPSSGRSPGLIEAAVIVLWAVVQAAVFGLAWSNHPAADGTESAVARCDRMAQIVSSRNLAASGDARGAQWRRARESAFAVCLDDPNAFSHSQGVQ